MVDFAVVALVLVQVILAGACFLAWMGIRQEQERIRRLDAEILQIRALAEGASQGIKDIEVTHYRSLQKRTDELADALSETKRNGLSLADSISGLRGQFAAFKRWNKRDETPSPDQGTESAGDENPLPLFPSQQSEPAAPGIRNHFGLKARKVA